LVAFATFALLPDFDVLLLALGAPDAGAVGHRGASHSLAFAVVIGLLAALAARRLGWPVMRTAVIGTLAVASHAALDLLAEGGRGLPLLWPLSHARFASPWRLLPDAPRGLRIVSRYGLTDLAIEFAVFFPVTLYALWPRLADGRWAWWRRQPALKVISGGALDPGAPALEPAPVTATAPPIRPDERDPPVRSSA
jgi:inner membrane protein